MNLSPLKNMAIGKRDNDEKEDEDDDDYYYYG
jgi:hypothetical protein